MRNLGLFLTKQPPAKVEEAPVVGTEELFSIETTPKAITHLEQTANGSLVSIAELDDKDLGVHSIQTEEMGISTEEILAGPQCGKESTPGITLFIKDEKNVSAYLYGNCAETLDTLVHILNQAKTDTNIFVSYCNPAIDMYDIMEVVGALSTTKGKVVLRVIDVGSVIGLLLLTIKNIEIVINNGLTVIPAETCERGSTVNVETTLAATKDYQAMVFAKLKEANLLTESEEIALSKTNSVIYIKGSDIKARMVKS